MNKITRQGRRRKAPKNPKVPKLNEWDSDYRTFRHCLGEVFIGQPEVTDKVAGILATYFVGSKLPAPPMAPRVLICGATSSGKSYLAEQVRQLTALQSTTINMGLVTGEGYKGLNLSDGLKNIIPTVQGPKKAPQRNFIILDEIDKLMKRQGRDVDEWISQIQFATLPLLNGDPMLIHAGDPYDEQIVEMKTNNSLIFLMGVFEGIVPREWRSIESATRALRRYGFCDEWISRLTHIIFINPLNKKGVHEFLEREAGILGSAYQVGSGGHTPISARDLSQIARKTVRSNLGLRHARMFLFEKLFKEAKKKCA